MTSKTIHDGYQKPSNTLHTAAGASSSFFTRLLSQPFDVIKIRFQLQVEPLSNKSNSSKYKTIYQAVRIIIKEEGYRALWKGHLPGQILSITYGATQFVVFQNSLAYLSRTKQKCDQTSGIHFLCGLIAASCGTITSYPFDVVRTRLVAQKSNQIYTNMREVVSTIYKTEGVKAYYKGISPSLLQNSLHGGLVFMFYNNFSKLTLTNTTTNNTFTDNYLNVVKQFGSGFFSGIVSKTIVYPLDLVKKRLQMQDFIHLRDGFGKKFICNGFLDCLRITIKSETFFGLFKGLSPSLLKAGIVTALNLTLYEQSFKFFHYLDKNSY